ncbi:MAG: ATP-dependent helicase, partial [Phycisphaerae bacterium]
MDTFVENLVAPLNAPQRRAVLHREGPLLVLAGPGSGKTRVITHRAAHLVHCGVAPRNILAITFTNKAAGEMRERLSRLGVSGQMWIHTFHALGVRLLREFAPLAKLQPGFTIYDDSDQKTVMKAALEIAGVRESFLKPESALHKISDAKNKLVTPTEFQANATFPDQITLGRVYDVYQQLLEQRNAVDFDDLLMKTALLLQHQDHITEELNIRFKYLLIDEYQDTNRAQ